jgi:4-amino-4-deoxy-L-arabinose transferase-like glycosyltransferase
MKNWFDNFQKYPQKCWIFSIFWLVIVSFIAFIWHLGSTGLVDETEPLFAEAARQMTVTGDWITPYFNGETRFDKPPLIYWLMSICYQLFGVNEWGARLPSAMAAIGLVILSFYTLRYFGFASPNMAQTNGKKCDRQLWFSAWLGSAIIAFNPETLIWARIGVSDMLLSGCMGIALLCFFWGYIQSETNQNSNFFQPNKWYLGFYFFLSLAVLAKGPVGIVLPGIIILSFLFYLGNFWQVAKEIGLITGMIIFFVITIPWYILVILRNGENYINSFFGYHNIERFTGVVNGHSAPWYFYFLVVLVGFAPWSVYLPQAFYRLQFWRRKNWSQQPRYSQLSLFAFFWFICIFIFFTVAVTKLPSYVLPLMPAGSILVALIWSKELTNNDDNYSVNRWLSFSIGANLLMVFVLLIAMLMLPKIVGYDPAVPNLQELIAESKIPFQGAIAWLITGLSISTLLTIKQQYKWIGVANLVGFILFFIIALTPTIFFLDNVRQLPLREIALMVKEIKQPETDLIMFGFKKPTLVFYSQNKVQYFRNPEQMISQIDNNEIPQLADQLLIVTESKFLDKIPYKYQEISHKGNYYLLSIAIRNQS